MIDTLYIIIILNRFVHSSLLYRKSQSILMPIYILQSQYFLHKSSEPPNDNQNHMNYQSLLQDKQISKPIEILP